MCFLLSLGASATRIKRNHDLVVENFRGFNNDSRKLGTINDRYFSFSGAGNYGVGNNDWNQKPIFTLFKNSKLSVNYQQLKFYHPDYFDFNWMVVFKTPDSARLTISDFEFEINGISINLFSHRTNSDEAYCYTMRIAEYMRNPNANYYIERTEFANYPFIDPLLIDTIYLRAFKWVEDGTDPEAPYIGMYVQQNKLMIHSDFYQKQTIEVISYKGDVVLKDKLKAPDSEFPLNVPSGYYWAAILDKDIVVYSQKIYIY